MSNASDYAPKPKGLRTLIPMDVPPIPGSKPLPDSELKEMEQKLHGYLKDINESRVYQIASSLKQLTWDEAESIGKGLAEIAPEGSPDAGTFTRWLQEWASKQIAPPSMTDEQPNKT